MDYYYGLKELVDSGKYDSRDDFTVVLQPYVVELAPWIDVSFHTLLVTFYWRNLISIVYVSFTPNTNPWVKT